MTEALKPCPFCGGEASSFEDYGHSTGWDVGCFNGHCNAEPHIWEKTKAAAITAWNTRADLVDPAAIREAALREAADVTGFMPGSGRNKPIMKPWRDAILALIDKKEG